VLVSDIRDVRPQVGSWTQVRSVHAATGSAYLPLASEISDFQPVERETWRTIRRHVRSVEGHAGIELVEEHDVFYAASSSPAPQEPDFVRVCLAGVVAFIAICLLFTMLGGGAQSLALIPVYWCGFFMLWRGLS
jgi:hypothetical protein